MSQHLQSVQVYHCESAQGGTPATLEKLIASIEKVAPMAKKRDRTDEAKAGFLKSAVMSRKWGVNAMASLKGRQYGYQDLIDALFSSIADEATYKESLAREEASSHNGATGYRKSRWKTSHKDFKEELFANQRKWGVDPTTIQRGSSSSRSSLHAPSSVIRRKAPCFNCEKDDCMLGRCKKPKDWDRIKRNIYQFRKERDAARQARPANISSPQELYGEYAIGLEEVLLAEVYGPKPTMTSSVIQSEIDGTDTSDNSDDENSVVIKESLHAQLKQASFDHNSEPPPCHLPSDFSDYSPSSHTSVHDTLLGRSPWY